MSLPSADRLDTRLRVLFLDLNAYFASCEQQEHPELRGKPIIVAPVDADTTCAIAASYEAKRFGIKTGTQVAEAKRLCPGLIVVNGRHAIYSQYHQRVLDAVDHVLPVERVCSIDEMRFQLIGDETRPARAIELAHRLKREIRERVGQCMTCSIGIAPNAFLAKLATEMQKPDGLVVLQAQDLPDQVRHLKLTDFTGINRRMQARLQANGIFSVEQLYAASPQELKRAFGSVVGERWWYLLRGYDAEQEVGRQKTLSNSHVLPPGLRTDDGCREVLLRLIQKATARLRADGLRAQGMAVSVSGFSRSWKEHIRLDGTSDTVAVNDLFLRLWTTRDFEKPRAVGVAFYGLARDDEVTPSLFEFSVQREKFNSAVDQVNRRFGKNTIYLAGMHRAKDTAEERIAFQKTRLFSEGAGDNEIE